MTRPVGNLHLMSQPAENERPPRPEPAEPVDPKRMIGPGGVAVRKGIQSPDYGTGTIVSLSANGAFVYWDKALTGTSTHLLEHDLGWLERQERLP